MTKSSDTPAHVSLLQAAVTFALIRIIPVAVAPVMTMHEVVSDLSVQSAAAGHSTL